MHEATSSPDPDWPSTGWAEQARCATEDPDLFFPAGSTGPFLEQIRKAKAVCWSCPVKAECLRWALAADQREGIWGGLTEEERQDLRRAALRQAISSSPSR